MGPLLGRSVPTGNPRAAWLPPWGYIAMLQTQAYTFKLFYFSLLEAISFWLTLYINVCLCFWSLSWDRILEKIFSTCFQRQLCPGYCVSASKSHLFFKTRHQETPRLKLQKGTSLKRRFGWGKTFVSLYHLHCLIKSGWPGASFPHVFRSLLMAAQLSGRTSCYHPGESGGSPFPARLIRG